MQGGAGTFVTSKGTRIEADGRVQSLQSRLSAAEHAIAVSNNARIELQGRFEAAEGQAEEEMEPATLGEGTAAG